MLPDKKGYFGKFGGRFIPEVLMPALKELPFSLSITLHEIQIINDFAFFNFSYAK